MSKSDLGFWIGAIGTVAGVAALVVSVIQTRRVRHSAELRQRWLNAAISEVARLVDQSIAVTGTPGAPTNAPKTELSKLASSTSGRLIVLYEGLATQFLAGEPDLDDQRFAQLQRDLAVGAWQSEAWRRARAALPIKPAEQGRVRRRADRQQLRMAAFGDQDKTGTK